jgi:hypothetical protein
VLVPPAPPAPLVANVANDVDPEKRSGQVWMDRGGEGVGRRPERAVGLEPCRWERPRAQQVHAGKAALPRRPRGLDPDVAPSIPAPHAPTTSMAAGSNATAYEHAFAAAAAAVAPAIEATAVLATAARAAVVFGNMAVAVAAALPKLSGARRGRPESGAFATVRWEPTDLGGERQRQRFRRARPPWGFH